ncbi:uncharacterized protein FIBRA_09520 [Fibroporia radiculosa]|uniref:VASt domain-containing protein n=1 Tax=Fibroporia radiculosa TaxID=599839 RepID=J7S6L8_9APHY|nr:uncharacterized protein FIBRA_09520 [Fibroporia radiculosa]CCM07179.1 predicted protein [Fibroporia radiculosa]
MAPNFLSKFVKSSPSTSSQRSRSPSPSPSRSHSRPSFTVETSDPAHSSHSRPRRHTTVGSATPSFNGSVESFPNVTIVPPSPHSTSYGSDIPDEPRRPSNRSANRVPSLTNLTPRSGTTDDEDMTTPTPATTRTTFAEPFADRSLAHSRSAENLRGKAQAAVMLSPTSTHPRSATLSYEQPYNKSQESLKNPPSKKSSKSKLRSSSRPRKKPSGRHDRSASASSMPNVTVTEDGVLTTSPVSDHIPPTPPRSARVQNNTYPGLGPSLLAPDNSDAVSTYSTGSNAASSRKRRPWHRSGHDADTSPAVSTLSLSPKRKHTGSSLASAIAASGLSMANHGMNMTPVAPPLPPTPGTSSSISSRRPRSSSEHSRNGRSRQPSLVAYPASDLSDRESFHSGQDLLGDESGLEDDDDDDDLDLDPDDIPVTGFAVASNKRNQDFHELFPTVPEGDYLIEDYGCALQREILIQGRLYVSENHICFHANIFGWITDLCIPMYEVTALDKRMTAFVIPNAIQVTTSGAKYTFTSFLSRDTTFDVIYNVWRLARPEGSSVGSLLQSPRGSIEVAIDSDGVSMGLPSASSVGTKSQVKNKVTQCLCGKNREHFNELAMESILPGTPEKIYNLMFTSGFIKDFMTHEQKLTDLQISDWLPTAENPGLLFRQMSYIKPLTASIGPRQTKCELRDETVHCDFDEYVVMLTTTRTPDVPSGGVFAVKTKTCITWASNVSTKVVVTTQVDWTGRSFIKGLIEKSAIDGQKQYHVDLDKSMRTYIHEHQSEFIPEGVDAAVVEEAAESHTVEASPRPSVERPSLSEDELRKAREYERNQRGLQWAYDTFEGALKVARHSTAGLIELLRDAWDQSTSTAILYFVIVFLVISNIWTLVMVGKREEVGRRKEMRKTEEREKWVQGVVTALWDELVATRNSPGAGSSLVPRPAADWRDEVGEINVALDYIEQRVRLVKESLKELD